MYKQRRKIDAEAAATPKPMQFGNNPTSGRRMVVTSDINDKINIDEWERRPRAHDQTMCASLFICSHRRVLLRRLPKPDDDSVYSVFVTYVEVYNNIAYDLLEPVRTGWLACLNLSVILMIMLSCTQCSHSKNSARGRCAQRIRVWSDRGGSDNIRRGARAVLARCVFCSFHIDSERIVSVCAGQRQRFVAHTLLNAESSRSHSIFTVRVIRAPLDHSGRRVLRVRLWCYREGCIDGGAQ